MVSLTMHRLVLFGHGGGFAYIWFGFLLLNIPWLASLAKNPSRTSQFTQHSQYNISRDMATGRITPNVTSNRHTQSSQANLSSIPSRTFHTIQSMIDPILEIIGILYSLDRIVPHVSLGIVIYLTSLTSRPIPCNPSRERVTGRPNPNLNR